MKKLALSLSMIVFLALGSTAFAQDVKPEAKKAETKKECTAPEKKSCCADKKACADSKSCTKEEKKACTTETKTPDKK
jgi:hypothetical protein